MFDEIIHPLVQALTNAYNGVFAGSRAAQAGAKAVQGAVMHALPQITPQMGTNPNFPQPIIQGEEGTLGQPQQQVDPRVQRLQQILQIQNANQPRPGAAWSGIQQSTGLDGTLQNNPDVGNPQSNAWGGGGTMGVQAQQQGYYPWQPSVQQQPNQQLQGGYSFPVRY